MIHIFLLQDNFNKSQIKCFHTSMLCTKLVGISMHNVLQPNTDSYMSTSFNRSYSVSVKVVVSCIIRVGSGG